jgi:hypothetical protein
VADVSETKPHGLTPVEAGALSAMLADATPPPPERGAGNPKAKQVPGDRVGQASDGQGVSTPVDAVPPKTVTWYRADGTPVVEINEKITQLPLDSRLGVDPERQKQLDSTAEQLLKSHTEGKPINFNDIGQILEAIAKNSNLTEKEKANVWHTIADHVNDRSTTWSKDGANPFVLNSNRTWRIAHEVFSFEDGYHASYLKNSDEEANRRLINHNMGSTTEDYFWRVGPSAHNDITNEIASRYQIQCLKSFMKGGFQAYADQWNAYFVSHLPQQTNDDFYQKIYQNTRTGIFPMADREEIAKLQAQYFQANRQTAPNAHIPEPVSIKDPADDMPIPPYPPF